MPPLYKHSLKCIPVNQIKRNIKGNWKTKEDSASKNDNLKLKDWDLEKNKKHKLSHRKLKCISPDIPDTSESYVLNVILILVKIQIILTFSLDYIPHSFLLLTVISHKFQEFVLYWIMDLPRAQSLERWPKLQ